MASRQQVLELRRHFEEKKYPTFSVRHEENKFTCFRLPAHICTELPNFAVQRVAGDRTEEDLLRRPDEVAVFAVSEEVKSFEDLVVRHEMFEYLDGCTCVEAAIKELTCLRDMALQKDVRQGYLVKRRALFAALIPYVTARPDEYAPEKCAEFHHSMQLFTMMHYWNSLLE